MMNQDEARRILHRFVTDEQYWREKVFASNPERKAVKLRECDEALAALNVLAPEPVSDAQIGLFDE